MSSSGMLWMRLVLPLYLMMVHRASLVSAAAAPPSAFVSGSISWPPPPSSSSSSTAVGANDEAAPQFRRSEVECNDRTCMKDQGKCVRINGKSECECLPGFQGQRCEELYCVDNCTTKGECLPSGLELPRCQCYEGYTGAACNLVAGDDSGENQSSKSKTTVLLSVFLAALLTLIFLLVASWHKNGKTTIIHPPPVPEGRELGPLVSRVTLTTTRFLWCSGRSVEQEDFFDNGTGPSRVSLHRSSSAVAPPLLFGCAVLFL